MSGDNQSRYNFGEGSINILPGCGHSYDVRSVGLRGEVVSSATSRRFLGQLHAGGEAEFGVDVGEVGLHRAR